MSTSAERQDVEARAEFTPASASAAVVFLAVKDGRFVRLVDGDVVVGAAPREAERPTRRALTAGYRVKERTAPRRSFRGFRPGQAQRAEAADHDADLETWRLMTEDMTMKTDESTAETRDETVGFALPMTTAAQVKRRDELIAYGEAKLAALRASRA